MTGYEKRFQNAFVSGLEKNGWIYSGSDGCPDYEKGPAIIPSDLKQWVTSAQPKQWSLLVRKAGNESDALKLLIKDIVSLRKKPSFDRKGEPAGGGTYNLLLRGVKTRNIRFKLFQNRPSVPDHSPEDLKMYDDMIFRVVSELHHSQPKPHDAVDLGFFINGIPVGTAELKAPISGQGVGEAEAQYRNDRIPGQDLILNSSAGALFHFAVATDRASLTTALCGQQTRFIPFNTGIDNSDYLQENPDDFSTAYLWKEVLSKNNLSLILSGMMRNVTDNGIPQTRFPRYHQLDNLKKITSAVQTRGGRKNYLSQHAPGSGKSDEIANLAYALSTLHDDLGNRIYSSVIIITNRTVLDTQIRGLLTSKIREEGYFHPIVKGKNGVSKSAELADKLLSVSCPRIMSVTAQTFTGTLLETMRAQAKTKGKLSGNYAIIVDEAHDGETGKQHENMFTALLGEPIVADDTMLDDASAEAAEGCSGAGEQGSLTLLTSPIERAALPALNFFAYTATPNDDALRVFGEKVENSTGSVTYEPFHTYSMHQAREEGYINDVLANYVTHECYLKIAIDNDAYEGDRIVDFKEGRKQVKKWMQTLPEVKNVIVEIVMQKMLTIVIPSLNGEGKAMLSCSSRDEAVAYKHLIDRAVEKLPAEKRFESLVAYSGSVFDPCIGDDVTELDSHLNPGLGSQSDLAKAFDSKRFRLMIVANKYQVGFDQPKLMCMFLDKPLKDINLIQTTARVNRRIPGKDDVYIFDFVNDKEQVLESFRKFDEDAALSVSSDLSPATLDRILLKSVSFGVHTNEDIEKFMTACVLFDNPSSTEEDKNSASMRMSNTVDMCSGRFHDMLNPESIAHKDDIELNEYKTLLRKFSSVYSLLSITRNEEAAIRAIYEQYGMAARFFASLGKALTSSRGQEPEPIIDVNALRLKNYEVIPQGSIGNLTGGLVVSEEADYSGDVSGVEFTSQIGPVEVLINEINDYPEFHGTSKTHVQDMMESVLIDMKSDNWLIERAKSNSETAFTQSDKVQDKIKSILSRQGRNKTVEGGMAKILMGKLEHDRTVITSVAQMLHKVLMLESTVSENEITSTEVLSPEHQVPSSEGERTWLESRLPSWVRFLQEQ